MCHQQSSRYYLEHPLLYRFCTDYRAGISHRDRGDDELRLLLPYDAEDQEGLCQCWVRVGLGGTGLGAGLGGATGS
jgi:hypothetical protein